MCIADARGFWDYILPLDLITMSSSLLYELIEWLAAEVLSGDLAQAYLGTQGDPWDVHKDMALASLGAIIAMLITAGFNYRCQRGFAREWLESWCVKASDDPLIPPTSQWPRPLHRPKLPSDFPPRCGRHRHAPAGFPTLIQQFHTDHE
jgi:hypothetical protein